MVTHWAGGGAAGGAAAFPGDSAEEKGLFQRPREKPVRREARKGTRRRSGGGRGKAVSCVWCMTQEGLRFAAVYRSGRAFLVCAPVSTRRPPPLRLPQKGDTPLHIAIRGRSRKLAELLLRNPKDGRLLYRPNKAGETPYNIDCSHQKSILTQIFGASESCVLS